MIYNSRRELQKNYVSSYKIKSIKTKATKQQQKATPAINYQQQQQTTTKICNSLLLWSWHSWRCLLFRLGRRRNKSRIYGVHASWRKRRFRMIGCLMIVRFMINRRRKRIYGWKICRDVFRIIMSNLSRSVNRQRDVCGHVPTVKSCVIIFGIQPPTQVFIVTMVNMTYINRGVKIGFHIQYNIPYL